jgi:predicted AAA+ superfamily ATPase
VSLGDVTDHAVVFRLLEVVGSTSAGELNVEKLSRALGTPASTIRRHIDLLEMLFLIRRVPAWSNNLLSRSIQRPKVHVADTGLLAYLIGADERRIETDLDLGGMFCETFVATEMQRQIFWLDDRPRLFRFRDRDQREVDIVLEHRDGSVSAVEVKSAATVHKRDFRGLSYLRDRLGDRFKAGALLYTGARTVPFGDRLAAVPLAGLWAP